MTIMFSETLAGQQVDLLRQLNDVLAQHAGGASFQIMFAPFGVEVAEDEVLVQVVNTSRGIVELHPRKLAELTTEDVIHATQVVDPTDRAFTSYAAHPQASSCEALTRPDGSTGHWYL